MSVRAGMHMMMKGKRVLVTGAAGFIGEATIQFLHNDGHSAIGLDVREVSADYHAPYWFMEQVDVRDRQQVFDVFSRHRPDAVIHLAANADLRRSLVNAAYDAEQNVIGTINVIGACQHFKVKRLVFSSTSAVYAPQMGARMPPEPP